MNEKTTSQRPAYQVHPIGRVRRDQGSIQIEIDAPFRPALKQLEHFSHVMVFWWADRLDDAEWRGRLQSRPPYAEEHLTGVFATRAPYRPNPIAMTTCKLLGLDEERGLVRVADIDAHNDTPIVDLKAYFPVCDRVREAHIPEWLSDWPEWMPDEGIGLEPWEQE
ncbi:MAG: tRNA (N6-threonylcarbamoyladenosine(37)-N6)-methyltransferase TrmO [Chloroflexota bacterium]